MGLITLAAGFALFLVIIATVGLADQYGLDRYGYAPFALPNVTLMLLPNGLLLTVLSRHPGLPGLADALLRDRDPATLGMLAGATLVTLGMLGLLTRRTGPWLALYATGLMAAIAPVLLFSQLFRWFARTGDPPGQGG